MQEDMRAERKVVGYKEERRTINCFKVRVKYWSDLDTSSKITGWGRWQMQDFCGKEIYVKRDTIYSDLYKQINYDGYEDRCWNWYAKWLDMDTLEPVTVIETISIPIIETDEDF